MTKKDYVLIASSLKLFAETDLSTRNANDVIFALAGKLGYLLHKQNPKFDFTKWDNSIFRGLEANKEINPFSIVTHINGKRIKD